MPCRNLWVSGHSVSHFFSEVSITWHSSITPCQINLFVLFVTHTSILSGDLFASISFSIDSHSRCLRFSPKLCVFFCTPCSTTFRFSMISIVASASNLSFISSMQCHSSSAIVLVHHQVAASKPTAWVSSSHHSLHTSLDSQALALDLGCLPLNLQYFSTVVGLFLCSFRQPFVVGHSSVPFHKPSEKPRSNFDFLRRPYLHRFRREPAITTLV